MAKKKSPPEYQGVAISYIRFSSKAQADGDSLRRQTESTEKFCDRHGLKLLDTYKDLGVSGYDGSNRKKGDLKRLLEALDDGKIEKGTYLIVESFDRLSRSNIREQYDLYRDLLRGGLNIVTLEDVDEANTPSIHYHDGHPKATGDAMSQMMQVIVSLAVMVRANNESRLKSIRSKEDWEERKKKALFENKVLSSICPSWLKVVGGKYIQIPERVGVIKYIFDLYANGYGYTKIANQLRTENIPPFTSINNKKRQHDWDSSKISHIIKSPAIYGCFRSSDDETEIEGYYPQVFDKDDYFDIIDSQTKTVALGGETSKFINTLRSIVRCGHCGTNLNYYSSKNGKWEVNGLRCRKCNELIIRYNECLHAVITSLSYNIGQLVYNQSQTTKEQRKKNNSLRMQIKDTETKLQKINDRIVDESSDSIDSLLDIQARLSQKIKELEDKITPIKSLETHLSLFGDEILTNGYLDDAANRKKVNGYLHALLGENGITAYKYSSNNSSLLIHTQLPIHVSIYRSSQRRPWKYCYMETIDDTNSVYNKVGIFKDDHNVRNQRCIDYDLDGGRIYSKLTPPPPEPSSPA